MKLINIRENEWLNDEPNEDPEQEMAWIDRKIKGLEHAQRVVFDRLKPLEKVFLTYAKYEKNKEGAKYTGTYYNTSRLGRGNVVHFMVPNNTPGIETAWPQISRLAARSIQIHQAYIKMGKTKKALNKAYRAQAMKAVDTGGTAVVTDKNEIAKIAAEQPEFHIGKRKMKNPLLNAQSAQYVGPPEKYPELTGSQMDLFLKIQKALKLAGRHGLNILYGCRANGYINFVAMTPDRKFAWRKYQQSSYSGANDVVVDDGAKGEKVSTAGFLENPGKWLK